MEKDGLVHETRFRFTFCLGARKLLMCSHLAILYHPRQFCVLMNKNADYPTYDMSLVGTFASIILYPVSRWK